MEEKFPAGDFKKINKSLYKTKDNEPVQFIPNPNFRLNIQSADMSEPDLLIYKQTLNIFVNKFIMFWF